MVLSVQLKDIIKSKGMLFNEFCKIHFSSKIEWIKYYWISILKLTLIL